MNRSLCSVILVLLGLPVSMAAADDRTRYLRDITVEQGQAVGDAVCFGCSVRVLGTVEGDVVAIGGDISIAGTVEGDAVAAGGRLLLLPGAQVRGEAVALGGVIKQDATARVEQGTEAFPYFHLPGQRSFAALGLSTFVAVNLTLVLLAGLIVGENRAEKMAACLRRHPWLSGIAGLLALGIFGVLFTVAASSGPLLVYLEFLLGLLFIAVLLFGYLGCCWALGRSLAPRGRKVATWLVGAGAWTLILLVPVAGFVASTILLVLAPGLAITSRFGGDSDWLVLRRRPS